MRHSRHGRMIKCFYYLWKCIHSSPAASATAPPARSARPVLRALLLIACERVIARYDPNTIDCCLRRNLGKQSMDPELVNRIYECSFVPELWPGVLREVGRIAEAGASLFITNGDVTSWTASKPAHEVTAIFVKEGWFCRGQIVARLFAAHHAGFLTDLAGVDAAARRKIVTRLSHVVCLPEITGRA